MQDNLTQLAPTTFQRTTARFNRFVIFILLKCSLKYILQTTPLYHTFKQ